MTKVKGYFIDNRLGHLDEALAVARSDEGGVYPVGTVIHASTLHIAHRSPEPDCVTVINVPSPWAASVTVMVVPAHGSVARRSFFSPSGARIGHPSRSEPEGPPCQGW